MSKLVSKECGRLGKKTDWRGIAPVDDFPLGLIASEQVHGLVVLGLSELESITDSLSIRGYREVCNHDIAILVLREVFGDGIHSGLGFNPLLGLELVHHLLVNSREAVLQLRFGNGGNRQVAKVDLSLLDLGLLGGTRLHLLEAVEPLGKAGGDLLHHIGILSGDRNDTADPLSNTRLLENDQLLDVASFCHMGSTTKFNADLAPLRILDISKQILDGHTDRNHTDRIRVCFAENSTDTFNLPGSGQGNIARINLEVLSNVPSRDLLNFGQLLRRNLLLVRKVEPQLLGSNQRSLLVNFVAENLLECVVEDVCTGVVITDWPSP